MLDGFICCAEGAVPLSEVYARLYRHALELARGPRIAEARALIGLSEDEYARRYCAQFGFPSLSNGAVVTVTSATNANAVMPYGDAETTS